MVQESDGQLQHGSLVALFVPKYTDEIPQIAKIVSVASEGSELVIEWLTGSYSSVWTACKRREGRKFVPWVETVKRSHVGKAYKRDAYWTGNQVQNSASLY